MTDSTDFPKKTARRASGHGVHPRISFFNPLRPLLRRPPLIPRNGEGLVALRAKSITRPPSSPAAQISKRNARNGQASPRSSAIFPLGKSTSVFSWEISTIDHKIMNHRTHERGAALLATTLAVLLILLAVGLSMVSSGLFEGLMSQTQSGSRDAFSAAQSGVKDASLRVARNKGFSSLGYFIPAGCTLNGATTCTKAIVEKDVASVCSQTISAGQDCLIITGTVADTTRTIEVILNVNATNGKISQVSWKEL